MPKIYSDAKRVEIRRQLLAEGMAAIRQSGYRSVSIEALTKKAGIAQGTFYAFFRSKEELVCRLAQAYRDKVDGHLQMLVGLKGGLERPDLRRMYRRMFLEDEDNIHRYLSREDMRQIAARLPHGGMDRLAEAGAEAERNIRLARGARPGCDVGAVVNWIRTIHIVLENRDAYTGEGAGSVICGLIENMLDEMFGRQTAGI